MALTKLPSRIAVMVVLCTTLIVGCSVPKDNLPAAFAQPPTAAFPQNYPQAYAFASNQVSACVPNAIEEFSATFSSIVAAALGNDVLYITQLPGPSAAALVYKVLKEEFEKQGIPDAEEYAKNSSDYLANVPVFTIRLYCEKSGHAVGTALFQEGFLNCFNADSLALQLNKSLERAFRALDPHNIESYILARLRSLPPFLDSIGYVKKDRMDKINELVKKEFTRV